jgi:uncharacterized membrane protein YhhN
VSTRRLEGAAPPQVLGRDLWLVAAAAMSLALHLRAVYWGPEWQVYLFKPTTTLLVLAIALRGRGATSRYRNAVVTGLVFSLVGDVMLMLPGDRFVPGLLAFLAAHLCYLVAFTDRIGVRLIAWPTAGYLVLAAGVLAVIWDRLGALRAPVLVYIAVIMAMAAQAAGRALRLGSRESVAAALGAGFFVASDASLAIERFTGAFPLSAVVIMTTYIAAQLLIARSVRED